MNLTTDPWIPVVWEDGNAGKVSLLDVFRKGDTIRDLAVRPHERIALMRLLICIAQAALDGPSDREEWKGCRATLPLRAVTYLTKWKAAFELFGNGQRFLQLGGIEPAKVGDDSDPPLVSKMDTALATGNASTLFDNAGGENRSFDASQSALMLLAFQCFAPGGLLSECMWSGVRTKKAGNAAAPCLAGRMAHAFVIDRNSLLRTLWLNLVSRSQLHGAQAWGMPVWELMPGGPADRTALENATRTYLGRLVPVSRAVRLSEDGVSMMWGAAAEYPAFADSGWRDPMATLLIKKNAKGEDERTQLAGSITRSLWRELHSIAVVSHTTDSQIGGPFALQNAVGVTGVDVVIGAVVYAPMKTTSTLDVVESVLHIPAPMFEEDGQRLYGRGVSHAQHWASRIGRAISVCRRELHDELDMAEFRQRGMLVKQKAVTHYWTAIEQKVPLLLALVDAPTSLRPQGATRDNWGGTAWGRTLAANARAAYELACPHETPRQLKAYALGLAALFKPFETTEDEPDSEETKS